MSVEVKIEFERECYKCYGNGYLLSPKEEKRPCERCRGTGRAPTELGRDLLEFQEHQGIKSTTKDHEQEKRSDDYL